MFRRLPRIPAKALPHGNLDPQRDVETTSRARPGPYTSLVRAQIILCSCVCIYMQQAKNVRKVQSITILVQCFIFLKKNCLGLLIYYVYVYIYITISYVRVYLDVYHSRFMYIICVVLLVYMFLMIVHTIETILYNYICLIQILGICIKNICIYIYN